MKFTVAFATLLSVGGLAAPLQGRQTDVIAATDELLFSASMDEFIVARNAQSPPELDWSSDGCSMSPDNPLGFDFLNSCYRHDFGYRNYKAQDRFDAGKDSIDLNFKDDMYAQCATESNQGACEATADLYYEAVKLFGKREEEEASAAGTI